MKINLISELICSVLQHPWSPWYPGKKGHMDYRRCRRCNALEFKKDYCEESDPFQDYEMVR